MKRIGEFFLGMLVLAVAVGCAEFFTEPETGMAMVRLYSSAARSIAGDFVPLDVATAKANTFTAVFINITNGESFPFDFDSIDSPQAIPVPAGTYDILVMAGYAPPPLSSSPSSSSGGLIFKYLLGSGYVQNKTLAAGNNSVTLSLSTIDIAYFLPPSVPSEGTLAGTLQIDLRNPLIEAGEVVLMFNSASGQAERNPSTGFYSLSGTAPEVDAGDTLNSNAQITIGIKGANGASLPQEWSVSDININIGTDDTYLQKFVPPVIVGRGTITGIITGSAGAPVAGATVEQRLPNGTVQDTAISGADGRYCFGDVDPNVPYTYTVKVTASGYSPQETTVTFSGAAIIWNGIGGGDSDDGNFALVP